MTDQKTYEQSSFEFAKVVEAALQDLVMRRVRQMPSAVRDDFQTLSSLAHLEAYPRPAPGCWLDEASATWEVTTVEQLYKAIRHDSGLSEILDGVWKECEGAKGTEGAKRCLDPAIEDAVDAWLELANQAAPILLPPEWADWIFESVKEHHLTRLRDAG